MAVSPTSSLVRLILGSSSNLDHHLEQPGAMDAGDVVDSLLAAEASQGGRTWRKKRKRLGRAAAAPVVDERRRRVRQRSSAATRPLPPVSRVFLQAVPGSPPPGPQELKEIRKALGVKVKRPIRKGVGVGP